MLQGGCKLGPRRAADSLQRPARESSQAVARYLIKRGAGERTRTADLLITNRLAYYLLVEAQCVTVPINT